MARVPTWTELRLDATKLLKLQEECQRSVHALLDKAIPELDRKLNILDSQHIGPADRHRGPQNQHMYEPALYSEPLDEYTEPLNQCKEPPHQLRESLNRHKEHPKQYKEPVGRSQESLKERREPPARIRVEKPPSNRLEGLEHVKNLALPMPLNEYLKRNRPDMVFKADQRVMYLRKQAETRKQSQSDKRKVASKCIHSFSRMRISNSCNGFGNRSSLKSSLKSIPRDIARDYQVECKLSEQEMRQLTARTYRRLPEVKRQRNEEVTKFNRIQNYKNKLEYGRRLLENRRHHGIINYPLRSYHDDASTTSQEDSLLNSYGG